MAEIGSEPYQGNLYRVKLVTQHTATESLENQERVVFDVTPELSESRTVNYTNIDPVHMPGQIYVYKNTTARNFSLSNIKLISRTQDEAEKNLTYLWLLRSWMMPRFGTGSSTLEPAQQSRRAELRGRPQSPEELQKRRESGELGRELLGSPPPVLLLSAYSRDIGYASSSADQSERLREHISRVPVVMQNLTIPYPSDVDYILTQDGVPMPTIMTIDMTLLETHSPAEYEKFSLQDYKAGILPNF